LSKSRKGSALVVLVALVALAAAVSAFGGSSATTTDAVAAGKPSEFKFTVAKRTVLKGTVFFKVTNRGTIKHDFKIAGKKTPALAPGKSATLKVIFTKAGRYTYLCTLPGHAPGGMKGVLTVK
jgi:uncharacterized cupredoxin-like copper-binding protein